MLGHLIRREILDHILSLRFLILATLGVLVIWLSLHSGYVYYQACLKDYRLAQAATQERIQQIMVAERWSEISSVGYLVHKPPTPLSIFVRGLEPTLGRSIPVSEVSRRLKQSPASAERILAIFPPLDLGQVVQIVLSLFVLLLTYEAVCGEKEAGTLSVLASFSVPRDRLLLGKLLGALIPTLTAFGLPLLIGVAVVLVVPEVQLTSLEWMRLGLILLAFGLYLTAFICAGLFASCLVHRAATSFALLLVFWVVTVAVLPRLSLIVANRFRPAPSALELQAEKVAIERGALQKRYDLWRQWRQEHFKPGLSFMQQPLELREGYWLHFSETRREFRALSKSQYDRLDEGFRNRYNARLDLAVALARLSPTFALSNSIIRLSGAGVDRHRRFLTVFDLHWERQQDWFAETKDRDRLRQVHPAKYGKYSWDISDMPRFNYQETWPAEDVQTALIDIGMLALWGLLFFLGAYVAMLRYDLR